MAEYTPERLTVDIESTHRTVYIKSKDGDVLFIVSIIDLGDTEPQGRYLVKVSELGNNGQTFDVSRQFFKSEERERAIQTTRNLIRDYQVLTDTLTEKTDPKELFNDTVNYRKIDPECCKNCVFCVFNVVPGENGDETVTELYCSNKKNLRMDEYSRELYGKYSQSKTITVLGDMIMTQEDCICDNYGGIKKE